MSSQHCICGRIAIVHCPRCGYATVRATQKRDYDKLRPDGSMQLVHTFACRKCALFFDDDEWQLNCQAPPPRGRQVADAARTKRPDEILRPEAIAALQAAPDKTSADVLFAKNQEDRMAAIHRFIDTMRNAKE